MLRHIDYLSTRTSKPFTSSSAVLTVRPSHGLVNKLNSLDIDDYIYIQLRYQHRYEVVKYIHSTPVVVNAGSLSLPVTRGEHGTTVTSWPSGTCVGSNLTYALLLEVLKARDCGCTED